MIRSLLSSQKAKFILAVVLLVVATGAIYFQVAGNSPIHDNINFVCVATGERFNLDRSTVTHIPARNPKTGEDTLMPCSNVDGVLKVSARYRDALDQLAEKNLYVDVNTLQVRGGQ
ncbi:MAG: hypothetical protein PVJ57_18395 [Phycisphaerae bacterium]|jgi:hypothetical protein